ncbi:MAG: DPP IV N-terminal domain-containing protein [Nocardioides sp.]|nr:DPP IV N-terminal domain-containing protein [Nocardioides sp.]
MTIADDGSRVVFLRAPGGTDPVNALWVHDVHAGAERLVADPAQLLGAGGDDVPPEDRARRERLREQAGGIVGYAMDPAATVTSFAPAGRLFLADLLDGGAVEQPAVVPVIDPRVDPTGSRVGYVADGALHVVDTTGSESRQVAGEDDDAVTWGAAEFIAAEEMDRSRGFWWAVDGRRPLAARVDESPRAAPLHRGSAEPRTETAGDPLSRSRNTQRACHRGRRGPRRKPSRRRVGHR